MLPLVQQGLERLYRIETALDVRDFVIDEETRDALEPGRAPREQLLITERDGELHMALFLDRSVIANLEARDPRRALDGGNLGDLLLAIEGVSHFVYLAWRARAQRQVSALELELQAEVDKWVTCVLLAREQGAGAPAPSALREMLFERFSFEPDLAPEERERYEVANSNAHAYVTSLEQRYVERGAVVPMLAELRRFYRLGVGDKLELIRRAA